MHDTHKQNGKVIKNIIPWQISLTDIDKYMKVIINYNIFKTYDLIITNNSRPQSFPYLKTI